MHLGIAPWPWTVFVSVWYTLISCWVRRSLPRCHLWIVWQTLIRSALVSSITSRIVVLVASVKNFWSVNLLESIEFSMIGKNSQRQNPKLPPNEIKQTLTFQWFQLKICHTFLWLRGIFWGHCSLVWIQVYSVDWVSCQAKNHYVATLSFPSYIEINTNLPPWSWSLFPCLDLILYTLLNWFN